ncbi:MAG: hypothetical protein JETCAE01_35720 [Anaerolineaceae bacterium]|nr:MAG: hypothetical protein JETCAE01_35720 [Anaerolineaceae bacterium]
MIDKPTPTVQQYEIRLQGHLDAHWGDRFEGLTITLEEDGNTLLSGPVADQSALHGLLKKVRDLGMPLVSINQVRSKQGETKMKSIKKFDTKVLLSTLWIAVMVNMLKADILSLFIPGAAEEVAKTAASSGASIPQLMLVGAVMGQIGIAMIVLSRVLKYGINRWVNIVAGLVTIAYIWGGMASYPHYIFIASVETLCLLLIIGFAWTWRNAEA